MDRTETSINAKSITLGRKCSVPASLIILLLITSWTKSDFEDDDMTFVLTLSRVKSEVSYIWYVSYHYLRKSFWKWQSKWLPLTEGMETVSNLSPMDLFPTDSHKWNIWLWTVATNHCHPNLYVVACFFLACRQLCLILNHFELIEISYSSYSFTFESLYCIFWKNIIQNLSWALL